MTPGQMLIAVFDELIKQLSLAQLAFENSDIAEINRTLQKSQHIISELKASLNFDYEISNNLNDIYNFFNRVIINANIKKDSSEIAEVIGMIQELRDAFSEANKLTRS